MCCVPPDTDDWELGVLSGGGWDGCEPPKLVPGQCESIRQRTSLGSMWGQEKTINILLKKNQTAKIAILKSG